MKKIVLYLLLLYSGALSAQAIVVPDANFMAKLLSSSASNDVAKDSSGTPIAIDANGNGVITEAEAEEVRELNVSGAGIVSLAGIEYFIDLRVLNCANNLIEGNLGLSGLENLRGLNCAHNALVSITFAADNDIRWADCSFNQLTSLSLTSLDHLETLDCGTNQLDTLDVTGLTYLASLKCNDNNLTTLDLTTNTALTFLACYANDLVTLFVKNGQNETFDPANWIENPTLEYICADELQVSSIQENENLPADTQVNSYCSYEPGGIYNRITGVVKFDANNNNNCGDAGDYVIPSLRLKIYNVDGLNYEDDVFTKTDGSYVFYVGGGTYTIEPVFENAYFTSETATVVSPEPNGVVITRNICVKPTGVAHPDVEVIIVPLTSAQPGMDAKYKMVYKNKGNQTIATGSVTCYWDSDRLTFSDVYPPISSMGVDTYTWNYTTLEPFKCNEIIMELTVNSATGTPPVNVGDVLEFGMSINPATDDVPEDNYFEFRQPVVGSLTSNTIVCAEGDFVSTDVIGDYLHYVVNFENTGTAPANFVVVEMDINPDHYDISTLRLINSSQVTTTRVVGDRITFRFEDANLSVAGHGNLLYKIKNKGNLMSGDVVTSTARIFMDYNAPVQTNDANTTFGILSIGNFEKDNSVKVYPNPSNGLVRIDADTEIKSISLYDIQGRQLQINYSHETNVMFDVSGRASGVYFMRVITEKGIKVEKLIRE
ncbi:DUF7619 domain-containing protein [Flavobacterium hauense]